MGISLTSIHIYGGSLPQNCDFAFCSFSSNWLTCVDDFSERAPDYSYKAAKMISKQTNFPVLHFGIFDSEMIWFTFFRNGKIIASYSDDECVANKKLFDIPAIVGYEEGNKRRLSNLLLCTDTEQKAAMLEEYFGVCLLYDTNLFDTYISLHRERSDLLYRKYQEEEKALTGKTAPISLDLIRKYQGKLFWNTFEKNDTMKPHFFLQGFATEDYSDAGYYTLIPVRFVGSHLEEVDNDTFLEGHIPRKYDDPRFRMDYGTPCKVTFMEGCPDEYVGKTMTLPNGYFPVAFIPSGELLLQGNHRIFVVDYTLKGIAKLTVKGDIADVLGNYILTTAGDSFCGYCYEPNAAIYIYELKHK